MYVCMDGCMYVWMDVWMDVYIFTYTRNIIYESFSITICNSCAFFQFNKANLRDLIAGTSLVILPELDSNLRFFSLCDLEIWQMTSKNNVAYLLYYIKLCASFQIHRWIQTRITVRKRPIEVKIGDILSRVTLKFDGWTCKTIGNIFYATLSSVHHPKAIGKLNLKLQSGNAQFGSKSAILSLISAWNFTVDLKNNRAPMLLQALCIIS